MGGWIAPAAGRVRSLAGGADGTAVGAGCQDARVSLNRIAWLVTVGICLLSAVLLFVAGYQGYGVLSLAVGAAAAGNLF